MHGTTMESARSNRIWQNTYAKWSGRPWIKSSKQSVSEKRFPCEHQKIRKLKTTANAFLLMQDKLNDLWQQCFLIVWKGREGRMRSNVWEGKFRELTEQLPKGFPFSFLSFIEPFPILYESTGPLKQETKAIAIICILEMEVSVQCWWYKRKEQLLNCYKRVGIIGTPDKSSQKCL